MHPFFVPRRQALAIPPPPLGQPISFSATIVPETPLPAQVAFIPPPPLQAHATMSPPPPRLVHVRPKGRFKLKKISQALPQLETAAPQQQDAAAPPQLEPAVLRMKLDYGFDVDCFFGADGTPQQQLPMCRISNKFVFKPHCVTLIVLGRHGGTLTRAQPTTSFSTNLIGPT